VTHPLDGILVVALEQAVAVPLATRKMADAGARVIKVERPEGDFARGYDRIVFGASSHFVWVNRGKESVALDFKKPEDAAFLHRLIAAADVFIQNLAPRALARAGFGARDLRAAHPRLITCDVSGYGPEGPYAEMRAYDTLVQGETGLAAVTGTAEAPARVGISICDIAAGMHAYAGVLEALRVRDSTGEGAALEVSLFDAMADWMSVPYLHWAYGGKAPERTGLTHPGIAPYGPFRSGEGDTVLIAVQNEREWVRLCEHVLERPDLAADARYQGNPARMAHRAEIDRAVQEGLARFTTAALTERLRTAGVAFGRVNTVEEFASHPQLRLTEIETQGDERVHLPASPVVWAEASQGDEARRGSPRIPALDEHGAALRSEFG
jgi:crotonobetainyl-CoA:carnitine CoA-transferase CaiB-like acyl-CoA transferase